MRNLLNKASGVAIAVAAAALLGSSTANAQATVIHDFGCTIGPPDWGGDTILFTTDTHAIVSDSGNVEFACFFDTPDGFEPERAEIRSVSNCGIPGGSTDDARSVSTPGGRIMLKCKFNGSSQ